MTSLLPSFILPLRKEGRAIEVGRFPGTRETIPVFLGIFNSEFHRGLASEFFCNLCRLGLGTELDGVHTWKNDVNRALATRTGQYTNLPTSDTSQ